MALSKEAREYFRKEGAIGGRMRARNLTKQQRTEIARKAVLARWAKQKKEKAEK